GRERPIRLGSDLKRRDEAERREHVQTDEHHAVARRRLHAASLPPYSIAGLPRIELCTRIEASPERCFDLSRDIDLHVRTMHASGERAVGGRTSGLIELGDSVTWRA